jgi:quercetin dioxygenase-like cupin family protein
MRDEPEGGDAACWAHLLPDAPGDAEPAPVVEGVDLLALAQVATDQGALWSHQSADLNVNLLVFPKDQGVAGHVNAEVDVLLLGIDGEGLVDIDGTAGVLRAGQALVIPKGARRSTRGLSDSFAYLSCHRRRSGLWPTPRPRDG